MSRLFTISLVAVLACSLAFVGCDSNEDEGESLIVGSWEALEASVNVDLGVGTVPVTVLDASNADQISMTFDADGRYSLDIDGDLVIEVQGQDFMIPAGSQSGTYDLVDSNTISFTADGVAGSTELEYDFRGDNQLDLIVENSDEGRDLLAFLLGLDDNDILLEAIGGGTLSLSRL